MAIVDLPSVEVALYTSGTTAVKINSACLYHFFIIHERNDGSQDK
jgi:hypothetical protein